MGARLARGQRTVTMTIKMPRALKRRAVILAAARPGRTLSSYLRQLIEGELAAWRRRTSEKR